MSTTDPHLDYLPPSAARLGRFFARPRGIAIGTIATITGLGWLWLALMSAQEPDFLNTLCRPFSAMQWNTGLFAIVLSMWCAMVLAMMLPSAAPMILTYAEIAATAQQKGEPVVTPFALTAGYAAIWLLFAAVAAFAHVFLVSTITGTGTIVGALAAGVVFAVAGFYQFTALKHACLRLCRQPFQFFFTNWQTTVRGVFGLGLRQGLYCLGCCWAMMALMFVSGAMNVLWMAALGVVMTIEKLSGTEKFSRAIGAVLIATGIGFVATSVFS